MTARGRLERRELLLRAAARRGARRARRGGAAGAARRDALALIVEELDALWRPQLIGEPLRRRRGPRARRRVSPQARPRSRWRCLDLAARRSDVPVWRLLGATAARPVRCNATLVAGAARRRSRDKAREWADARLRDLQAEGRHGRRRRAGARGARRASARQARIRVDANGGWSVDEAAARLEAMGPLELAEQPVATLDEMARAARRAPTCRWPPTRASSRVDDARAAARRLRRRDREARQGRRPAAPRARSRERLPGVPVERARRAGRDRRRRARGAGDPTTAASRTASPPRCCSPTRSATRECAVRGRPPPPPGAARASASRSTRTRSRAGGSTLG